MNKRRRILLLALPLVLGALLGGAKWKQLHPTPTQFDLQERAHLREAKIVELVHGSQVLSLPVDAFKERLNDFYLLGPVTQSNLPTGASGPVFIPRRYTIRVRKGKGRDEYPYLAEIYLSDASSYIGKYPHKAGFEQHEARLHPLTERRLRDLIALYRDAY